jgi:hypothetical protein
MTQKPVRTFDIEGQEVRCYELDGHRIGHIASVLLVAISDPKQAVGSPV